MILQFSSFAQPQSKCPLLFIPDGSVDELKKISEPNLDLEVNKSYNIAVFLKLGQWLYFSFTTCK
jgi:hypothetical protein